MKKSFKNSKSSRYSFLLGIGILLVAIAFYTSCSVSYPDVIKTIKAPDVSTLRDGVYEGSYFLMPVKVEVRVKVESGRIQSIDLLKHFNGQGKPAEVLLDKIIEAQSVGIEVVSGATHSSVVILKAVENALNKGL